MATQEPNLVKLQINTAGAWRDVLRFDIDAVDVKAIQAASVQLVEVAYPQGGASLRIVTTEAYPRALWHWDLKRGWEAVMSGIAHAVF